MRTNPENPNNRLVVPPITNPDAAAWKLPGGVKDRRAETNRRRLTSNGEIIVEVPFTEDQARTILAFASTALEGQPEPSYELGELEKALGLLKAALDYSVGQVLGSGLTSGQRQGWIDSGRIEEPLDEFPDNWGPMAKRSDYDPVV